MDEQRLYEPLPHGTIRLVRLLRGQWNDPLKLDLFIANVSHHYVGLSYTWGSCKKDHEAVVNGIVKKIGLNLHCALRTLRSENESLILWVDALCINQDDKAEKSLQVNSMHQIFEKAQRVHAYVGTSLDFHRHQTQQLRALDNIEPFEFPEDDDAAWTTITSSLTELESNDPALLSPAQRCKCTLAVLRALSSPSLGPKLRKLGLFANQELEGRDDRLRELFEWLRNFVIAPWWARMWIIQEVGAARGLRLTYGKITMPFSMLESAAQELIARPWSSRKLGSANAKVLERFVAQVQTICSLRQLHTGDSARYLRNLDYYERSWGSPLLWLLRTFRHRHSSEPRDKIFALSNVLSHLSPGYYDLGIDYNAPISDLFCQVALSIIQQTGFFWVTSRDIASKHRDNLPSWVPDWSWGYHNTDSDIPLKIRLCHNASQVKFVTPDTEDGDATPKYDIPHEFFSTLARSDPVTWRRTKAYKHAPKTWTFQEGSPLRDVGKMDVTGIHLDWPTPENKSRYIWYEKYDPDSVAITKVHHCLKIPSQFCSTVEFVSETLEADLSNLNSIVDSLKKARFKVFPDDWKCNFFEDRLYLIGRVICFGTVLEDNKPPRRLEEYDDPNLSLLVLLRNQKYDSQEPEEFDAEWKRVYRVKFMAETTAKCNRCSTTEAAPCQECVDTIDQMEIPPPAEWRKDPGLVALKKTAMKVAPGHCILFTRDGNLALGPPGVQTGDRISILMGGLCPHILRRRHEHHYLSLGYLTCSLIGDCYLNKAPRWDPSRLETIALV